MKSFNKLFAFAIAALVTVFGTNAFASTILNSHILPSGGTKLRIKFTNFDMGVVYNNDAVGTTASSGAAVDSWAAGQTAATGAVPGEDGWGIFKVTDLFLDDVSAINPVWSDGDSGVELVGMFSGLTDTYVEQTDTTTHLIQGVGVRFELFEQAAGTFDETFGSSARTGATTYTSVTGGDRVLSFDSAAGHLNAPGDNGGAAIEFENVFDNGNFTGEGGAFADIDTSVIGDQWAPFLDSDSFTNANSIANGVGPADLELQFDTFANPNFGGNGGLNDWLVQSDDPVRGNIVPLPGAASMGFGLMGLLAVARKRRNG